jgi:hypothetical protein
MEVSGQFHAMANVPMGEEPWLPTVGGWLDLRAGLDILGEREFSCLSKELNCGPSNR